VPVLFRHMDARPWVAPVALWLGCLIMMPRRLLQGLGVPFIMQHWRVPLVLGLVLLIIILVVLRERAKCDEPLLGK
jgi:hypothetical protein